jgi:hypothetical protein
MFSSFLAEAAEPREVSLIAYLIDIDEIDSVKESFTVNLFMVASWHDPELAHSGTDSISKDLDDIWFPRLQILNEQSLSKSFPRTAEVQPDGTVIYRQRFFGTLSQPLELERFPFDSQTLNIIVVGLHWGGTKINLVTDPDSTISETLRISDWQVKGWDFSAKALPIGRHGTEMPGAVFSIDVKRETAFFTSKVISPLLLIVAMSWLVLWLDPSLVAPRISVAVTTMLTLIAYRFAIGGMVPRLPFLTSLDYFVLAASILVFLSLAAVIWSTQLNFIGNKKAALALDRKILWISPLLYMLILIETFYLHLLI